MTASFPNSVKSFGSDRVNGDYIPASDMNDVRAEVVALETAALAGWFTQTETWTYASASSFTVAGDRTAFYTKGRRIKWTHATVFRYGVISSSSYGAPNTTVTILVNNDYVISNSTIITPAVSDLDNPIGFPDWFSWIPSYSASGAMTYTAVTTQLAKYRVTGRCCQFMFRSSGTLGGVAGNAVYVTCPVTPIAITGQYLAFAASNSETTLGTGTVDTVTPRLMVQRTDVANFSLAAGKVVNGQGMYEW